MPRKWGCGVFGQLQALRVSGSPEQADIEAEKINIFGGWYLDALRRLNDLTFGFRSRVQNIQRRISDLEKVSVGGQEASNYADKY